MRTVITELQSLEEVEDFPVQEPLPDHKAITDGMEEEFPPSSPQGMHNVLL